MGLIWLVDGLDIEPPTIFGMSRNQLARCFIACCVCNTLLAIRCLLLLFLAMAPGFGSILNCQIFLRTSL